MTQTNVLQFLENKRPFASTTIAFSHGTRSGRDHTNLSLFRWANVSRILGTARKFRDWRKGGHGWLDVYRAIEVSADTFFYDMAYRVGIDKIHDYMTRFGFGQYSGLDIEEESAAPQIWRQSYSIRLVSIFHQAKI